MSSHITEENCHYRSIYPLIHPWTSKPNIPKTIRVLRTNESKIVEINYKEYVKNVLPNEWTASWDMEALKAGALAVKTYAWYWILHQNILIKAMTSEMTHLIKSTDQNHQTDDGQSCRGYMVFRSIAT
jgi:peptidoglycan hydrolase-like amidase